MAEEQWQRDVRECPFPMRGRILDDAMSVLEAGEDSMGFCLACGDEAYGVEPDARGYKCESCGQRRVYGAEELIFMLG